MGEGDSTQWEKLCCGLKGVTAISWGLRWLGSQT